MNLDKCIHYVNTNTINIEYFSYLRNLLYALTQTIPTATPQLIRF